MGVRLKLSSAPLIRSEKLFVCPPVEKLEFCVGWSIFFFLTFFLHFQIFLNYLILHHFMYFPSSWQQLLMLEVELVFLAVTHFILNLKLSTAKVYIFCQKW